MSCRDKKAKNQKSGWVPFRNYGSNGGLDPERIGFGIEVDETNSSGPSEGEKKSFGLEGGSSPEWVGQEIEGSCGKQDGPVWGAKALSSSVIIVEIAARHAIFVVLVRWNGTVSVGR